MAGDVDGDSGGDIGERREVVRAPRAPLFANGAWQARARARRLGGGFARDAQERLGPALVAIGLLQPGARLLVLLVSPRAPGLVDHGLGALEPLPLLRHIDALGVYALLDQHQRPARVHREGAL